MSIRRYVPKAGKVSFYVYVTGPNGAPEYVGKRGTKKDARQLETEERAKRMRGQSDGGVPATLDDAWELVLPELSSRSRRKYAEQWRLYLRPHLGKLRPDKLTSGAVRAVREALLAGDAAAGRKPLAPSTVGFVLRVLSLFVNLCVERGWLVKNPAAKAGRGLLKPKHTADQDDGAAAEDLRFISTKESMAKVLRSAPAGAPRDSLAFGMFTGCRIGEVCAVDWQDVNFESNQIRVCRSVKGPTKSGKARRIPIQRQLRPLLERRWLAQGRPDRGRVFPEVWGARELKLHQPERFVRGWLNDALAAADLDHFTTHEAFRHTFASHFVMDGGDIFRLAKYLGHSDVRITFAVYAHLRPGAFAEDEDRIVLPPFEEQVAGVVPILG